MHEALASLWALVGTMHTDRLGSATGDNWNGMLRYPVPTDDPLVIMSYNQQGTTNDLFEYVDLDLNEEYASTAIVKKAWWDNACNDQDRRVTQLWDCLISYDVNIKGF